MSEPHPKRAGPGQVEATAANRRELAEAAREAEGDPGSLLTLSAQAIAEWAESGEWPESPS